MQLASSLPSSDLAAVGSSLPSTLAGGDTLPRIPPTEGSLAFAQRFPDLASAGRIAADAVAVPSLALSANPLERTSDLVWIGNFRSVTTFAPDDLPAGPSPATTDVPPLPVDELPVDSFAPCLSWVAADGSPVQGAGSSAPSAAAADTPEESVDLVTQTGDGTRGLLSDYRGVAPGRAVVDSRYLRRTPPVVLAPVASAPEQADESLGTVTSAREAGPSTCRTMVGELNAGGATSPARELKGSPALLVAAGDGTESIANAGEMGGRPASTENPARVDGSAAVSPVGPEPGEADRAAVEEISAATTSAGSDSAPVSALVRVVGGRLVEVSGDGLENLPRSRANPALSATSIPESALTQAAGRAVVADGLADVEPTVRFAAAGTRGSDQEKKSSGASEPSLEKRAGSTAAVPTELPPSGKAESVATAYRNSGDDVAGLEAGRAAKRESAPSTGTGVANASAGRAANLAVVYGENPNRVVADARGTARSFLIAGPEEVAINDSMLGTHDAKLTPAMFANAVSRQPSPDFGGPMSSIRGLDLAGEQQRAAAALLPTTNVQHSVNAVLEAVERFAAGGTQGVNLQFTVAGAQLAIRVELRGGEVHATFRTDSSELRLALAQEWQTASGSESGRPLRAIDPVFAPAKSGGLGATSDESSPQFRHESDPRQSGDSAPPPQAILSRPGFPPVSVATVAAARPAPDGSSLRLHAFA